MKKRLFTMVLMVMALVFAMAMGASAADEVVAKIGNDEFFSLEAAFNAAKSGNTIILMDGVYTAENEAQGFRLPCVSKLTLKADAGATVVLNSTVKTQHQPWNSETLKPANGNTPVDKVTHYSAITLDGLTINQGFSMEKQIIDTMTIKNCTFNMDSDNRSGAWAKIADPSFQGGSVDTFMFTGNTMNGSTQRAIVWNNPTSKVVMTGNVFNHTDGSSLEIWNAPASVTVSNNTMAGAPIEIASGTERCTLTITNNQFHGADDGTYALFLEDGYNSDKTTSPWSVDYTNGLKAGFGTVKVTGNTYDGYGDGFCAGLSFTYDEATSRVTDPVALLIERTYDNDVHAVAFFAALNAALADATVVCFGDRLLEEPISIPEGITVTFGENCAVHVGDADLGDFFTGEDNYTFDPQASLSADGVVYAEGSASGLMEIAAAGDTMIIHKNVEEYFVIDKAVHFVTDGENVTFENGILIQNVGVDSTEGVTIDGFIVEAYTNGRAIACYQAIDNMTIANNTINGMIIINNDSNHKDPVNGPTLDNLTITNNVITATGENCSGIFQDDGVNTTISHNTIVAAYAGINFGSSSGFITNNTIRKYGTQDDVQAALAFSNSVNQVVVKDNTIKCQKGEYAVSATNNSVVDVTGNTWNGKIKMNCRDDDDTADSVILIETNPATDRPVVTLPTTSYYTVKVTSAENGRVALSGASNKVDSIVTITATPDAGYEVGAVTVYGADVEIPVTDNGDGTYSFKQPGSSVTVKVIFVELEKTSFVDVAKGAYYYDAIQWAVENQITMGTSDYTFSPNMVCTRAQAVTFLWNAAGKPQVGGVNPFQDVAKGAWYYDAVLWAVSEGITNGTSETTFGPDSQCTRSHIVTFMWNTAGKPAVSQNMAFADVAGDTWYTDAVRWAVAENIAEGLTKTMFGPAVDCTRGQIVTFLYRHLAEK